MSNIKNGGLDQYGTGPFEHQQFGTAGVERVKNLDSFSAITDFMQPLSAFYIIGLSSVKEALVYRSDAGYSDIGGVQYVVQRRALPI